MQTSQHSPVRLQLCFLLLRSAGAGSLPFQLLGSFPLSFQLGLKLGLHGRFSLLSFPGSFLKRCLSRVLGARSRCCSVSPSLLLDLQQGTDQQCV